MDGRKLCYTKYSLENFPWLFSALKMCLWVLLTASAVRVAYKGSVASNKWTKASLAPNVHLDVRTFLHEKGLLTADHKNLSEPLMPFSPDSSSEGLSTLWPFEAPAPYQACNGPTPSRALRFYAVFVFSVYPRRKPSSTATTKRAPRDYTHAHCSWAKGLVYFPSWTTTWPAAKTKILLCVFFPRNDNYSTLNIFQTSTTKMEKAFEEIIY